MTDEFYSRIRGDDRFLILQWDTLLLRTGCMRQYMDFHYIGAAWQFQDYFGNGGLTLRSRSRMLELIHKGKMNKYLNGQYFNEDLHFSEELRRIQ